MTNQVGFQAKQTRRGLDEDSMKNQIYLIPGLFGFTELGAFNYFHQVAEILRKQLYEQGVDAEIIEVETIPTGSVKRRAERLIETVRDHGGLRFVVRPCRDDAGSRGVANGAVRGAGQRACRRRVQ